ncbi:MAG: hypothetical protein Q8L80_00190 [Gallionella sp.]|nr:hypothetical protein [Gallionella sp.]MDP1941418.1 hypothetical protein [Gallionella sp.]
MPNRRASDQSRQNYHNIEKNAELALAVFNTYYRAHNHSGKLYEEFPDFFLIKPDVLADREIATRPSEQLLLTDCISRAQARNGYVGVSKHRNPKLGYYWLELSVAPFMLCDTVTPDNRGEFFYILTKFIEFTKQHPKMYGDVTADIASDKDVALMFNEINTMAKCLNETLDIYPEKMLVSFNPKWPISQVKKLLLSLKNNDQDWCELFFEHLIYVMGKKPRG